MCSGGNIRRWQSGKKVRNVSSFEVVGELFPNTGDDGGKIRVVFVVETTRRKFTLEMLHLVAFLSPVSTTRDDGPS